MPMLDEVFMPRNPFREIIQRDCVYLHAWSGGREARAGIGKWIEFYNRQRPHSALAGRTPYAVYWNRNDQEQPGWQARFVA